MNRLRIAVMMEDCLPTEGGGYSYYQTLLKAIDSHCFHQDIEIVHVTFKKKLRNALSLKKRTIFINKAFPGVVAYASLDIFYRFVHRLFKKNSKHVLETVSGLMDGINNIAAKRTLIKENIQLVYYLKPTVNVIDYPMIVTHWDVGHKSMYPFPEVAWNGNYEKRESYYRKILSRAFLILCESQAGARELQKYYPVNAEKLRVLPIFGGELLKLNVPAAEQCSILSGYKLSRGSYFLYPAQFWAHKNHATLLHAFYQLKKKEGHASLKLVLCGSDQGNLGYIKTLIESLDLSSAVLVPGFVSNKELYALYKNAIALAMPTFLGPTNTPLIEAAELECAVICSNLQGHREILGDNALYFDASSVQSVREALECILNDELRSDLVSSAYRSIMESSFHVEKSLPLLDSFLQHVKTVRNAWGTNLKLVFAVVQIGILSLN